MGFVSAEAAQERIGAALDAIDAAHDVLRETSSDLVPNSYRVEVAERLETQERVNRGVMYRFFGEIAEPPDGTEYVPAVRGMLWERLRITPKEITRRFRLAARIRPRRSLTGPPLPPELPELAGAVETGTVGEDHIRAVCRALDVLPTCVSPTDVAEAERTLVAVFTPTVPPYFVQDTGSISEISTGGATTYNYTGFAATGTGVGYSGSASTPSPMTWWGMQDQEWPSGPFARAFVATNESIASSNYGSLTTTTDEVEVIIGSSGMCQLMLNSFAYNTSSYHYVYTSVELSGANTMSAASMAALGYFIANGPYDARSGLSEVIGDLNPGRTKFSMQYATDGTGTGWFSNRAITIIPM